MEISMQLKFQSPYLSIDEFDLVELPSFMVLTGVNGSGKTHLLEAINQNHVTIEGLDNPNIVLFNYETFKLENEAAFNGHQLASERESAWKYYNQHVKPQAENWKNEIRESYSDILSASENENKSFWYSPFEAVKNYRRQVNNFFRKKNQKGNNQAQGIRSLAKRLPYSIDEISQDDFLRLYKPYKFKNDFLPHQLGRIFWDYYVKYRENQVNEFQNEKHGTGYNAVSEEEFLRLHGKKPWDLVNRILEAFDSLTYRVTSPEGADYFGTYQLRLQHTEKEDLQVDFSHLSSGERILMALVASIYKSSSDNVFPEVLMLDEVDASLHPSMMKNMIDVVQEIFVAEGVNVILISHSPTTIALAPDESIFIMNRAGPNRIEKKSRQEALSILTQGYATLEEGLKIFDEVARADLTLITEGHNAQIIRKALDLKGIEGIEVLEGVEGLSGKNQLKTVFQFICKTDHKNKVLFIWDCDVSFILNPENNTFPFTMPKNPSNQIAKKGIENAFSENLMADYTKTIIMSNGTEHREFDGSRKNDFAEFVVNRNKLEDFSNFETLFLEILRIKNDE